MNILLLLFAAVRLSESLYSVKVAGEGVSLDVFNRIGQKDDTQTSCLPKGALEHHKKSNMIEEPQQNVSEREYMRRTTGSPLSGHSFYVDVGVSDELRRKVYLGCMMIRNYGSSSRFVLGFKVLTSILLC